MVWWEQVVVVSTGHLRVHCREDPGRQQALPRRQQQQVSLASGALCTGKGSAKEVP